MLRLISLVSAPYALSSPRRGRRLTGARQRGSAGSRERVSERPGACHAETAEGDEGVAFSAEPGEVVEVGSAAVMPLDEVVDLADGVVAAVVGAAALLPPGDDAALLEGGEALGTTDVESLAVLFEPGHQDRSQVAAACDVREQGRSDGAEAFEDRRLAVHHFVLHGSRCLGVEGVLQRFGVDDDRQMRPSTSGGG